jgi:hypothetical protein
MRDRAEGLRGRWMLVGSQQQNLVVFLYVRVDECLHPLFPIRGCHYGGLQDFLEHIMIVRTGDKGNG